jgi:hypothetical protein
MGFQDNSGDIILDVVLTDEGRNLLADPAREFNITKFKLADDEINYELFDKTTGSAYQDLQILQTPVFEAFTNNTSTMSSLLVTYDAVDLLYLPVIKLNEAYAGRKMHPSGSFMVAVDQYTEGTDQATIDDSLATDSDGTLRAGFLFGYQPQQSNDTTTIRVDAGIDTQNMPYSENIDDDLRETRYLVEMDSRLGTIVNKNNDSMEGNLVEIDEDGIGFYDFAEGDGTDTVTDNTGQGNEVGNSSGDVIFGPRATFLEFRILSSQNLRQSNFYFERFGGTTTMAKRVGGDRSVRFIDTLIKITGVTTGYSIDIPIRYVKVI